ncbi:MAG: hydroxychlorobactene glucosyltransferase CruC [Anaerolineae bacterium]
MLIVAILITVILIGLALIGVINALTFPRLDRFALPAAPLPFVSLLVPARDEAPRIAETVRRLLAQDYPAFEVIILDDHSTDGTAVAALAAGGGDPRLRVIPGADLPPGWAGKNWACHQLSQAARGEILVFTDADVRWEPRALPALVGAMEASRADLYGIWPTQQTITRAERLVVPLMTFVVLGYLPVLAVHHIPWPVFAAANGQCMAWRRHAYLKTSGHVAVRAEVLEDVLMARRVKAFGLRLRIGDGAGLIGCRMYDGWPAVRDGYAKNIFAGYGESYPAILAAAIFHWALFLLPWVWLALGWLTPALPGWPLWPALLIALGVGLRALTAAVTRQRIGDAILMPVSVLLMTVIAARSVYWYVRYGGPQWRGRTIRRR